MDVKYTDDVKKRMMSLMPCASTSTYEWTPDAFKDKINNEYVVPEDKWPVISIRALTTKEHAALRRLVLTSGKIASSSTVAPERLAELSEEMHESMRKLVVGWHNFTEYVTGEEYKYEQDPTGGASKDKWEHIPDPIKGEMFQHVCRVCGIMKMESEDRLKELKRGL